MTHAHSYKRCRSYNVFLNASTIILRVAAFQMNAVIMLKKKHSWRSLVHLLHSVVSSLLQTLHGCRDARISDPKACTRKHAPHHPIAHTLTQRHDRGTRCDLSRNNCANTLIQTKTKLCDMKHITKSHMSLLHCRSVIYMHTLTMQSNEGLQPEALPRI